MSATVVAAMSGVPVDLQAAGATTGSGTVVACPMSFRNHNFLVIGSSGVASGAVTLETSNDPNDAGTWAALASAVTVVASTDLLTQYTGILNFVRARISTVLSGGTVRVTYTGGKSF